MSQEGILVQAKSGVGNIKYDNQPSKWGVSWNGGTPQWMVYVMENPNLKWMIHF